MRLADKLMLRCYNLLDYDWTPLNQNPCCVCMAALEHMLSWYVDYEYKYQTCVQCVIPHSSVYNVNLQMLVNRSYTTFMDPGTVRSESSNMITIHWHSSHVQCVSRPRFPYNVEWDFSRNCLRTARKSRGLFPNLFCEQPGGRRTARKSRGTFPEFVCEQPGSRGGLLPKLFANSPVRRRSNCRHICSGRRNRRRRRNVTNIRVLGKWSPETLQIQWFLGKGAPKRYKYKGFLQILQKNL